MRAASGMGVALSHGSRDGSDAVGVWDGDGSDVAGADAARVNEQDEKKER